MDKIDGMLWVYSKNLRYVCFTCVALSFVSASCNTPETFHEVPSLSYITIVVDLITGTILFLEVCVKSRLQCKEGKRMKDRWHIFDSIMVIFIWLSVIIQIAELTFISKDPQKDDSFPFGLFRTPRALILLRMFRCFSFQFESGRLTIIVVRAGQQIGGATVFLLFFLLLYGFLGVQLFGDPPHRCVTNDANLSDTSLSVFAIPDTFCSIGDATMCPPNFRCANHSLTFQQGGYGRFDNLFVSIKTVYESASQEGWVFLMYRNIDSYPDWHGYLYFVTLIFFLAWLVKNVFIAVIIETFAEIRVQLQNAWGNTRCGHSPNIAQMISNEGPGMWTMVDVDMQKGKKRPLDSWRRALRSRWYYLVMTVVIVLNTFISAFRPYVDDATAHNHEMSRQWSFFGITELVFTLIFDIEAVIKVTCLGVRGYFKRNIYKYEAFLALMTTINTIHSFHPALRSFPVLRIIRLLKLSRALENFAYKIFGPAKKIGMLVTFTLGILTLMSTISLHMLCYVRGLKSFSTFPRAFMSMFQIMTQEGWIDVMHEAMDSVGSGTYILVSIYFILYHMFVTTVLLSLFVAVILDNLELDEGLKRYKQVKVNEQRVDINNPLRLRIFEHFPNRPEMVHVSKLQGEFVVPRLRDSFLQQFIESKFSPGTAHHVTGLPHSVYSSFSPSSGILASTALATRLAVQEDGLPPARLAMVSEEMMTHTEEPPSHRKRLDWRRSKQCEKFNKKKKQLTGSPIAKHLTSLELMARGRKAASSDLPTIGGDASQPDRLLLSTQHFLRQQRRSNQPSRVTFYDDKQTTKSVIESPDALLGQDVDFKLIHLKRQQAILKRQRHEEELRENHPLFDTPLLIIKREGAFRRFCKLLVSAQYGRYDDKPVGEVPEHGAMKVTHDLLGLVPYLDWVMIFVTILSCSSMMLESTTMRIHDTQKLQIAEYIFVAAMGCELLLKIFANGLFFTPKPTFKDLGAFLDLATFIVSFAFVCTLQSSTGNFYQLLMVMRCLRPLRIFMLVPQIRKVVLELFRGFNEIVMVVVLLIALVFVFASFGVQLYGGKLAACNDLTIKDKENCTGIFLQKVWISNSLALKEDPPEFYVPRVWTNPRNFDFDTTGAAMLALFEVLSLKGWVEVRDVIVERMGPTHALYIHIFVFLGCMVGLTLFIGVVIANYNENKGTALLTVDQRRWTDLKSRVKIAQPLHLPRRPSSNNDLRGKMYDLAETLRFKIIIACFVLARSILLSIKWDPSDSWARYLIWASIAITIVFVAEIVIKIIGMTFLGMMCSWRNRYDLLVTILELVWIVLYFLLSDEPFVYNAGWMIATLRFFSICGKHATLKMLLMTVAVSVYRSFFIIVAMFLLLLCYAYAGVVLFGTVKYGENIDRHANFASAPLAVTVLFRIVTGEDWNKIMHDCMIQPPRCTPAEDYWNTDCGNVTAALIYFCSFYVIIAYIMLNLLVAIIIENFSLFYTMDDDILLGYNDLHMFQVRFNEIETKKKGMIPVKSVATLLESLQGRLQIRPEDSLLLKHMKYEMERIGRRCAAGSRTNNANNINNVNNKICDNDLHVTFHDVLMMIAYRSVDIRKCLQLEELLMREKLEAEIEEEVAKCIIRDWFIVAYKKKKCREQLREAIREKREKLEQEKREKHEQNYPNPSPCASAVQEFSQDLQVDAATPNDTDKSKTVNNENLSGFDRSENKKTIKHRRRGLYNERPVTVSGSSFPGDLPSLVIDGMLYDDNDKCNQETVSIATGLDTWWRKRDYEEP